MERKATHSSALSRAGGGVVVLGWNQELGQDGLARVVCLYLTLLSPYIPDLQPGFTPLVIASSSPRKQVPLFQFMTL